MLTQIRKELQVSGIWIDGPAGVSLFTYDNKTFGLYCHTWDGCTPQEFNLHIKGEAKSLRRLPKDEVVMPWHAIPLEPLYTRHANPFFKEAETVFRMRIQPGDFSFFEIV